MNDNLFWNRIGSEEGTEAKQVRRGAAPVRHLPESEREGRSDRLVVKGAAFRSCRQQFGALCFVEGEVLGWRGGGRFDKGSGLAKSQGQAVQVFGDSQRRISVYGGNRLPGVSLFEEFRPPQQQTGTLLARQFLDLRSIPHVARGRQ